MKATILFDPQDPFYDVIFTDRLNRFLDDVPQKMIEIDGDEEQWIRKTFKEMEKLQEWLEKKFKETPNVENGNIAN